MAMFQTRWPLMCVVTLCLLLPACGGGDGGEAEQAAEKPPAPPPFILVHVANKTGKEITHVSLESRSSGFKAMSYGVIGKGKTEKLRNDVMPTSLQIHWNDLKKERHSAKVNLQSELGKKYYGSFKLSIYPKQKVTASRG